MSNSGLPAPLANPVPGIPVGVGDANSAYSGDPLLVPDFYKPMAIGGQMAKVSPNDVLSQTGYARTTATATATVSGVTGATDAVHVTFTNGVLARSGGPRTVSAAAGSAATDASLADAIVTAINDDPVLQAFGISATVAGAVVTINHPGPVGNFTTVSYTATSGSPVLTFSPVSGLLAGGGGAAFPFGNFPYSFGGQTFWFKSRTPEIIPQPMLVAMVRDGMPIG